MSDAIAVARLRTEVDALKRRIAALEQSANQDPDTEAPHADA